MDQEGLEGLDSFTLARIAWIAARRRAVMPPMTPPPAPTPHDLQEPDPARAFQAAREAGWTAGRHAGWQQNLGPALRGRGGPLVPAFAG
jgi:hypothetical protein